MYRFVLFLIMSFASDASAMTVTEVTQPVMCEVNKMPIGCAALLAIILKERGQREFCTLQSCPVKI